jgi:fucose permease
MWGSRVAPTALLRASLLTALGGAALVAWRSGPADGAVGLPVLGLGLAAVFPTLVALTPSRVGRDRAARVIGLEVAMAALGGGVLPGLMGLVLDARGLGALGPLLVGTAVALIVLDRLLSALTARAAPLPTLGS